jgi:hypothetical protein
MRRIPKIGFAPARVNHNPDSQCHYGKASAILAHAREAGVAGLPSEMDV